MAQQGCLNRWEGIPSHPTEEAAGSGAALTALCSSSSVLGWDLKLQFTPRGCIPKIGQCSPLAHQFCWVQIFTVEGEQGERLCSLMNQMLPSLTLLQNSEPVR